MDQHIENSAHENGSGLCSAILRTGQFEFVNPLPASHDFCCFLSSVHSKNIDPDQFTRME